MEGPAAIDDGNGKAGQAFAPDPYIGDLIKSINDDAARARTAALAMLLTGLYLAGTVIATTDEAMLRGASRELPQLGISLPVVISYSLAPPIFLFLHVSTVILFERIGEKMALYHAEIGNRKEGKNRERYDALLISTNFVQALLHARDGKRGGWLLRAMSWLTVTGLPLLVLLSVQIDFIRYQDEVITWLQRIFLSLDVIVLGWFYIRIADANAGRAGKPAPKTGLSAFVGPVRESGRRLRSAMVFLIWSLLVLWIGWFHAIVPGPQARTVGVEQRVPLVEAKEIFRKRYGQIGIGFAVVRYLAYGGYLLDGVICPAVDRGCRYLRLPRRNLFGVSEVATIVSAAERRPPDDAKVGARPAKNNPGGIRSNPLDKVKGLDLRGRTLRFADFTSSRLYKVTLIGADLRRARMVQAWLPESDLSRANLDGANLVLARLQGANLSEAELQGADLREARLQRVNLRRAQLQGADLRYAQLQGANLSEAELQDADLREARLQGADLRRARLQGANLRSAHLQGVDLYAAQLQGADLGFARLQDADLREARLQRVNLRRAQLQGADFGFARLQGANLRGAGLQGADLRYAQLQGADLRGVRLEGANLRSAQLQGANLNKARLEGANLHAADIRGALFSKTTILRYADLRKIKRGSITDEDIKGFERNPDLFGLDLKLRSRILGALVKRRGKADNLVSARTTGAYCFQGWQSAELKDCGDYVSEDAYYQTLIAKVLRPMACRAGAKAGIVRGLARRAGRTETRRRNGKRQRYIPRWHWRLAMALLDAKDCAGHRHLSKATVAALQRFVKRYKPEDK